MLKTQDLGGGKWKLTITGGEHKSVEEIFAIQTTESGEDKIAGKLNVISYYEKNVKVAVVPVNNSGFSTSGLASELSQTFKSAVLKASTSAPSGISVAEFDNIMDAVPTGILSNYTPEMKKIIRSFKSNNELAEDTYYVFAIQSSESGSIQGFMPKGKGFGFVFLDAHANAADLNRTIAHEIAHGALVLEHNFEQFSISKGSSPNLMDYGGGNILRKYQWDLVHDPKWNLSLFDEDNEAGSAVLMVEVEVDPSLIPEPSLELDSGLHPFLTPSGVAIKSNLIQKVRFTKLGWGYVTYFKTTDGTEYVSRLTQPVGGGNARFYGYIKKSTNQLLKFRDFTEIENNQKIIAENGGYFQDFSFAQLGEMVYAIGKKPFSDGLTLIDGCNCVFKWSNLEVGSDIVGRRIFPKVPYERVSYHIPCQGANCPAEGLIAGVGEKVYTQLLEKQPTIPQEGLLELANFLSTLLKDKRYAFFADVGDGAEVADLSIPQEQVGGEINDVIINFLHFHQIYNLTTFKTYFTSIFDAEGKVRPKEEVSAENIDLIISNVNVWGGIDKNTYNAKSKDFTKANGTKYEYRYVDLVKRHNLKGSSMFWAILETEKKQVAWAISADENAEQLQTLGDASSMYAFMHFMAAEAEILELEVAAAGATIRAVERFAVEVGGQAKSGVVGWLKQIWKKAFGPNLAQKVGQLVRDANLEKFARKLIGHDRTLLAIDNGKLVIKNPTGNKTLETVAEFGDDVLTVKNGSFVEEGFKGVDEIPVSGVVKNENGETFGNVRMIIKEDGSTAFKGIKHISGSGPVDGVLEVSYRIKSVNAFKNFNPKPNPNYDDCKCIEFIYDSKQDVFLVGQPSAHIPGYGGLSPHQKLQKSINSQGNDVVGGVFSRGNNGEFLSNEYSGHFHENWDKIPNIREKFKVFLKKLTGEEFIHSSGF